MDELRKLVPEEQSRKTIAKVFDESTIQTLHFFANQGYFKQLEFLINIGKEAHVFRASDGGGSFRAVKIYKTLTSEFKRMNQYIQGDNRFKKTKQDKYSIVQTWTRKEYKNLELANKAGVRVPLPIAFRNNVLIMEFIGKNGKAAPTLKEKSVQNPEHAYHSVLENMARLAYRARIVHSDLSEYNILNNDEETVIIDIGQGVLTSHPNAKRFFERDIRNIVSYFRKQGVQTDYEQAVAEIKTHKNRG